MSKSIPVFAFAFIAFAMTRPTGLTVAPAAGRSRSQEEDPTTLGEAGRTEAERFVAAWRSTAFDRRGFKVCVRASKVAGALGFRLLAETDPRPGKFEYVWLCEIEERSGGFVGQARGAEGRLADALSKAPISFRMANIAHWAFAPSAVRRGRTLADKDEPLPTARTPAFARSPRERL
jgi:hypothetical protein